MRLAVLLALAPILVPALAACTADVPSRYAGTLTRTSGACASGTATLSIRGTAASFTPTDGVLIMPGTIEGAHVHAALTQPGMGGHPFPMVLDGTLTPTGFTGHYRTPQCRADVVLKLR